MYIGQFQNEKTMPNLEYYLQAQCFKCRTSQKDKIDDGSKCSLDFNANFDELFLVCFFVCVYFFHHHRIVLYISYKFFG